jgi:hypothetical protein
MRSLLFQLLIMVSLLGNIACLVATAFNDYADKKVRALDVPAGYHPELPGGERWQHE